LFVLRVLYSDAPARRAEQEVSMRWTLSLKLFYEPHINEELYDVSVSQLFR
jgi:hypothetical protein